MSISPLSSSDSPSLRAQLQTLLTHVESTNTHITHLESLLSPSAAEQIATIKLRLKDAHRSLEKLGERFGLKGVEEITREVWRSYRRLRGVEEVVRGFGRENVVVVGRNSGSTMGTEEEERGQRRGSDRGTEVVWAESSGSDGYDGKNESGEFVQICEKETEDVYMMSGALPALEGEGAELARYYTFLRKGAEVKKLEERKVGVVAPRDDEARPQENDGALDQVPALDEDSASDIPTNPRAEDLEDQHQPIRATTATARRLSVAVSSKAAQITNGYFVPNGASLSVLDGSTRHPSTVGSIGRPTKSWRSVRYSLNEEEAMNTMDLYDPDRNREGSGCGWQVTYWILTGTKDERLLLPELEYIKVHEARVLKKWLMEHKYLRRSRDLSRMEKLLHLLTLLQWGCRFESVAVLFSRTPREVQESCSEVFEGLLEMFCETMLPGPDYAEEMAYEHCWHISRKYEGYGGEQYFRWSPEDVVNVLVTLNLFIGRYRKHGQLMLIGQAVPWGKYVRPVADKA